MEKQNGNNFQNGTNPENPYNTALAADFGENRVAGTVGAFLFALIGGVIYWLLWQVDFLAAISGIIGVSCAFVGYRLFARKESTYGVVISVVMAALVIILAWYICLSQDVYNAYREWYKNGEIDYTVSFATALRYSYTFLADSEVASSYITNLVIGIILCVAGCIAPIKTAAQRAKAAKQAPVQPEIQAARVPVYGADQQPTPASVSDADTENGEIILNGGENNR